MGVCSSKKIKYIEPSKCSENLIKLYFNAEREFTLNSIIIANKFMNDEELKKEYFYLRKLIIVSAFLKDLPKLFDGDYNKMKIFLEKNRIPQNVYLNIYNSNNNKECILNKYINILDDIIEKSNIETSDSYIGNSLHTMKSYIYDIILI